MTLSHTFQVLNGPEAGSHFDMAPGTYRVIARAHSDIDSTIQMATGGDRLLPETALEIAEKHIAKRPGGAPGHRLGKRVRDPDLEIDDPGISRNHAMLFHDQQGLSVVDLMSTNGTLVNDNPVADSDLQVGDVISVGTTCIKVVR